MNPDQFTQLVADYYTNKGYQCDMRDGSYDHGVDIIAKNEEESIAIQVKMYDDREVNYETVMYLFAGQHLYDCDLSIMISSGSLSNEAKKVADKLGVDVYEYWKSGSKPQKTPPVTNTEAEEEEVKTKGAYPTFFEAWERYIIPLKGTKVYTATGLENLIIDVSIDGIKRESSTGNSSTVKIEIFRQVYNHLLDKKKITRDEINHLYPNRASAIITPLLAKIPFIEMKKKPIIALNLLKIK